MDKTFNIAINLIEELFDISKEDVLNSSLHKINDYRKIIVLKFYNLRKNKKDNTTNTLATKFNCNYSNIIYLHNKAQDLYSSDQEFKGKYDLFSNCYNNFVKLKNSL